MTYEQQVTQAATPKDAMVIIARALDELSAKLAQPTVQWGEWPTVLGTSDVDYWPGSTPQAPERSREWLAAAQELAASNGRAVELIEGEDHTDVVIPAPSEERMEARRMFERQQLKLDEQLPEGEDWGAVYARGGPMWLYLGNRELVMTYPEHTRRQMVADVELDSPEQAHEMARDILKEACQDGPSSIAMGSDTLSHLPR